MSSRVGGDARGRGVMVGGRDGDAKCAGVEGDVGADEGSFGVAGEVGRGCCAAATTSSDTCSRAPCCWGLDAKVSGAAVDTETVAGDMGELLTVGPPPSTGAAGVAGGCLLELF